MHPAMAARLNKLDHPERYCPDRHCLWNLRSGPCPQHQGGDHLRHWPAPLEKLEPGEPDPRD